MVKLVLKNKEKIIRILEWTGIILFGLLAIFMAVAGISSLMGAGGGTIDLSKYIAIRYSGFEGKGNAELDFDKAALEDDIKLLYAKYESGLFPIFKNHDEDDYEELYLSFEPEIKNADNLKNGDEVEIIIKYNEELAAKLNEKVENCELMATVQNLEQGKSYTEDEIFGNLKFSIDGVSPALFVKIANKESDDFLKTIDYRLVDDTGCYKNGDVLKIEAIYNEEEAEKQNVDLDGLRFVKEFQIDGFNSYVSQIDEVPKSVLDRATEVGKTYFGDANDYGLRIITEARLYPDFSKGYEFTNPELISAYLEVLKDPTQTSEAKPYNYLELCYNVHLGQPGGNVGCMAEAIVCFSNLTIDENGNCVLDESTGKLFSASHNDSSIKKNLNEWFGSDYEVKKFTIE